MIKNTNDIKELIGLVGYYNVVTKFPEEIKNIVYDFGIEIDHMVEFFRSLNKFLKYDFNKEEEYLEFYNLNELMDYNGQEIVPVDNYDKIDWSNVRIMPDIVFTKVIKDYSLTLEELEAIVLSYIIVKHEDELYYPDFEEDGSSHFYL